MTSQMCWSMRPFLFAGMMSQKWPANTNAANNENQLKFSKKPAKKQEKIRLEVSFVPLTAKKQNRAIKDHE